MAKRSLVCLWTASASCLDHSLLRNVQALKAVSISRNTSFATRRTMSACAMNPSSEGKKCVPCESLDASAVWSLDQVTDRLQRTLPLWNLEPLPSDPEKKMISKSFTAKNFQAALDSLNDMGAIAEQQGHHPDFHLTDYRKVRIDLFTHNLQGLTENDLTLAELLDEVPILYSPKWLREHPAAAAHAKNEKSSS